MKKVYVSALNVEDRAQPNTFFQEQLESRVMTLERRDVLLLVLVNAIKNFLLVLVLVQSTCLPPTQLAMERKLPQRFHCTAEHRINKTSLRPAQVFRKENISCDTQFNCFISTPKLACKLIVEDRFFTEIITLYVRPPGDIKPIKFGFLSRVSLFMTVINHSDSTRSIIGRFSWHLNKFVNGPRNGCE